MPRGEQRTDLEKGLAVALPVHRGRGAASRRREHGKRRPHPHYRQVSTCISRSADTFVESSLPVQNDAAMADDSTTIELSRSELREVAGYAVACARPALAIFERERPGDRRHDPRSRLQRRSQVEASGPSCYVTARGRPTGSAGPRCGAGCGERRCARGRPGGGCGVPPPAAKLLQVKHILGSAAHAARAFELFAGDDPAVRTRPDRAVPDSCASRRSGSPGALPECTPGGGRVGSCFAYSTHRCDDRRQIDNHSSLTAMPSSTRSPRSRLGQHCISGRLLASEIGECVIDKRLAHRHRLPEWIGQSGLRRTSPSVQVSG